MPGWLFVVSYVAIALLGTAIVWLAGICFGFRRGDRVLLRLARERGPVLLVAALWVSAMLVAAAALLRG